MTAATALASACLDGNRLVVIEADISRRFVPTIRVHHRTPKRWLAVAQVAKPREHAEALLPKMEHVMCEKQGEMVTENYPSARVLMEVTTA
ncbi:hypothetical protein [Rhizobacter sp. Root1221]|uniref:hypothetical protein n=1 Tax=Rhizobacter sp. Root1221 TaxID=1736433 RepID=UPI0006F27A6C|nr:hypothetical protein [Rhizobacter sp. Root1221]KQW02833.1 hypothetical protein ASC87_00285 [Rhizobacter sp. Root1221]